MKKLIVKLGDIVCMLFIALVGMAAFQMLQRAESPRESLIVVLVSVGLVTLTCMWFVLSAIHDELCKSNKQQVTITHQARYDDDSDLISVTDAKRHLARLRREAAEKREAMQARS